MVKKLWLHASWRSHRGMPCAEFGWPRDWAQALYASWTMQHCCICAWASMVYLKACVMWNCIAGLPGDLSVGPIARPNWSDINNISSAYKMHVQYAVCILLCCMQHIQFSDRISLQLPSPVQTWLHVKCSCNTYDMCQDLNLQHILWSKNKHNNRCTTQHIKNIKLLSELNMLRMYWIKQIWLYSSLVSPSQIMPLSLTLMPK